MMMLSAKLQKIQCDKWAEQGETFSEELYVTNIPVYEDLKSSRTYLSIAIGIALTWTKHAVWDETFISKASGFIDGANSFDQKDAEMYKHRFGAQQLFEALNGLKCFHGEIKKIIPEFETCSAKDIKKFQDQSFRRLSAMKDAGRAYGVGPWLFLGPFKIILGLEKRLWDNSEIDAVVLPSGIEVNRAVKKIVKAGYPIASSFDANYLVNEERTLGEGYTIDTLIQDLLSKIAAISQTRTMHINSAFYLYGAEG
jgi:hypothetical protein